MEHAHAGRCSNLRLDQRHTCISLRRQIELAKRITNQGICATLQHHDAGREAFGGTAHGVLKDAEKCVVTTALEERHIEDTLFAAASAALVCKRSRARKEKWRVVVQGARQNSVRVAEGFLHSVAVMNVNLLRSTCQLQRGCVYFSQGWGGDAKDSGK